MGESHHPDAPAGKERKYARREHERRFLLAERPGGAVVRTTALSDRYIDGTRIRLRHAEETTASGSATVYKLTQKIPAADGTPGLSTNFYLSEAEHARFALLPARVLQKTRYSQPPLVVDVFAGELRGLILAELEVDNDEELRAFVPPAFAVAEVTSDLRFTGGRLATTAHAELQRILASFGL